MKASVVRPIAICVFQHNGRILAAEGYDPVKGKSFYRPLGGEIEFGEPSAATIARELREELGAAVTGLRYLGTLENIFTYGGETGHEIVMVYDGTLADPALYERQSLEAVEDDGQPFRAVWVTLADAARTDHPPVYPDGLIDLLRATTAAL